jgi:hypothetical protein
MKTYCLEVGFFLNAVWINAKELKCFLGMACGDTVIVLLLKHEKLQKSHNLKQEQMLRHLRASA